jgi:Family of unknown function (DUF6171)
MLKLKEKLQKLSDSAQKAASENLNEKVPSDIQELRWQICKSCDKLYTPTSTCKLCGCFMQVKTWMPRQKCPVNKWGKHEGN